MGKILVEICLKKRLDYNTRRKVLNHETNKQSKFNGFKSSNY